MSNDEDWVAEVRRWVAAGSRKGARQSALLPLTAECNEDAIGYEAAHPALQAAHWPDAPRSGFGSLDAV